jgi:hypothetical protein
VTARLALALAAFALTAPLGACTASGAPSGAGTAAARAVVPPRFSRLRRLIDGGLAEARRADAAALRARSPDLVDEGLALIKGTLPHDLARTDVPRYLEGRALFGEALKRWVVAVESGTDAEVLAGIARLDDACRGWIDGYLGRAPETSV